MEPSERQIILNKALSIVSKLRNGYKEIYKKEDEELPSSILAFSYCPFCKDFATWAESYSHSEVKKADICRLIWEVLRHTARCVKKHSTDPNLGGYAWSSLEGSVFQTVVFTFLSEKAIIISSTFNGNKFSKDKVKKKRKRTLILDNYEVLPDLRTLKLWVEENIEVEHT